MKQEHKTDCNGSYSVETSNTACSLTFSEDPFVLPQTLITDPCSRYLAEQILAVACWSSGPGSTASAVAPAMQRYTDKVSTEIPCSTPTLQTQLDEITANTRALVPPERLARTEAIVAELVASGLEQNVISIDSVLPSFALKSAAGKTVRSEDLLALGSLVVKFFRGRWDPYDMTELETWQALQSDLRSQRALFVAISPQLPRQNAFTAERHGLTFPILSDPESRYAEQLGMAHTVPEPVRTYYRSMLVNIPFLNGDETWRIPLPSTVVADTSGRVRYVRGFADHRKRPEPAEALAALPTPGENLS